MCQVLARRTSLRSEAVLVCSRCGVLRFPSADFSRDLVTRFLSAFLDQPFNPYNNVSPTGVPLGIIRTSTAITAAACAPEANGRLSGACLQNALQTAGCTPQGSLSLALNGFSSTTNISSIQNNNPNIATYGTISPSFNLTNFLSYL